MARATKASQQDDRRRGSKASRSPWRLAAAMLAAVAAAAVAALAPTHLTPRLHDLLSYSRQRPLPPGVRCDAAVVLGYALHQNGSCTMPLLSRVAAGVALYEAGAAARLVFSGAHPGAGLYGGVSEANAMLAHAQALAGASRSSGSSGDDENWLMEEGSTSTRTNALFSLRVLDDAARRARRRGGGADDGGSSDDGGGGGGARDGAAEATSASTATTHIALVTNPFHQLRSFYVFRRAARDAGLDVEVYVAATPFAGHHGYGSAALDALADQADFWRELAALALYWARGWL